ncbi:hypothetical protein C1Y11_25935 [Pseudomonas sp. FW305-20]|nr:hypothetical protein C1Y11_25935 [Pseudomonas sp. FW305-20]PMU14731.1 hypothetical protein C1Y10_24320 [Pseudomonas sp. FW305-122]PMU35690.1 hypothetical protein C1Y12_24235 [Pseudomonas sp. FW305-47B]PMX57056.1 hypothetical protein C1Y13_25480 [Pseudomonas sp. FW305-33]PMX64587.1 hypothetical protein C1X12_20685 [Pseudomonas sp. FW305-60]
MVVTSPYKMWLYLANPLKSIDFRDLIVPTLCVGMQPVTLRVTGRGASLEAFPRWSMGTIIGFISQPKVAFQGLLQDPPIVFIKSTPI